MERKSRKAPNVQRLQIIVRLLFHTELTTGFSLSKSRADTKCTLESRSTTKLLLVTKSRERGRLMFRSQSATESKAIAIVSLVRSDGRYAIRKPGRTMKTMPHRELMLNESGDD